MMALQTPGPLLLFVIVIPVHCMIRLNVTDELELYHTLNFTNQTFSEFYTCLCKQGTSECEVLSTADGEVLNTARVESVNYYVWSSFYYCEFDAYYGTLDCKRMDNDQIGLTHYVFNGTTAFRLLTAASCDMDCVGLVWKSGKEGVLVYDEETDNIETCVVESCGKSQSQQPESEKQTTKETDTEPAIIVGVILGILLIASFIVIGILVWKLRQRENLKLSSDPGHQSETRLPASRTSSHTRTSLEPSDHGISGRSFRLLSNNANSQPNIVVTSVNGDEKDLDEIYVEPDGFTLDEEEADGRQKMGEPDNENTQRHSDVQSPSIVQAKSETDPIDVQNSDYGNVTDEAEPKTEAAQGSYSELDVNSFTNDHNYSGLANGVDPNVNPTEEAETSGDTYEDLSLKT